MSAPTPRKKLIEVSIPLEAINAASAREKSIRHGHPSTLHLWWARRPLAACRAVLFAQLVDDPSAWPDRFPDEAAQDKERRRLHKVIERMVPWEASNDEAILNEARWEIARSVAWGRGEEPPPRGDGKAILAYLQEFAPPVYDPFSGGGSIPLEAQRLGLRAYGSDLNPVAVLIGKALVEIPPKFAGMPPVNPESRARKDLVGRQWKGAQGLAEDVRYYGKWMRDEAEKRIGHLYPKAKLPDGSEATVIAWLWARTVRSPDPAAKGAMVPLVSNFMLSTKEGKKAWIEVVLDPQAQDGWRFEVKTGVLSKEDEERLKKGTKSAKAQAFVCALTGSAIDRKYIQSQGKLGLLGSRLMTVVAEGTRGRRYIDADEEHNQAPSAVNTALVDPIREDLLSGSTPSRAMITGGVCSAYGLSTWGSLYTDRQIECIASLQDLLSIFDAQTNDDSAGTHRLTSEYASALKTYLALAIDRVAMAGNNLVRWNAVGEKAQHAFGRQAFGMIWDYAETNILGDATGSLISATEMTANGIEYSNSTKGSISQRAAQDGFSISELAAVSTDPPYYDNVAYAELSAFFYPWLRRALAENWPNEFRRLDVPKDQELVATVFRHGTKEKAENFFLSGMKNVIDRIHIGSIDGPLTIYYAFKQTEESGGEVTSSGWASFLQAIVDANMLIDGTWPVRTEMATRMVGQGSNALASSIVLVCRKRPDTAATISRADFLRALRRELPPAIAKIRDAGIGPIDMEQAVIGPGMGVFSRYAKVREDDDSAMSVKTALALINRVREELLSDQDAAYDAETQVALAWFTAYGFDARPSGEAITLAQSKNTALGSLFASGVFKDERGKVRLTKREELPADWSPLADRSLTVWECVQHTARVLFAEGDGGQTAAAKLVKGMGQKGADALALAYRLYDVANGKGQAAEARVYAELAAEWPTLEVLADGMSEEVIRPGKPQMAFDL